MPVASKDCQIFASCSACEPRTSPGRKLPVWAIRLQFASRQTPHTPRPRQSTNLDHNGLFLLPRAKQRLTNLCSRSACTNPGQVRVANFQFGPFGYSLPTGKRLILRSPGSPQKIPLQFTKEFFN